jgi:hypothetical protein
VPDSRLARLLDIYRGCRAYEPVRWLAVEEEYGLRFPGSYKTMIEEFGVSSWDDFLHIFSPFSEEANLRDFVARTLDAERISRLSFPSHYPLPLYPEAGGLFPWAVTDNGDTFYFITAAEPDDWPTVIKGPRAPEFEVSFLPPSLIVHHFAAGKLRSSILPAPG